MSTFDWVKKIIVERFEVDAAGVTPETVLEDLEFDSLFLAELLIVLGEELQIKIPDRAVTPRDTLADLVQEIEERRSEGVPS